MGNFLFFQIFNTLNAPLIKVCVLINVVSIIFFKNLEVFFTDKDFDLFNLSQQSPLLICKSIEIITIFNFLVMVEVNVVFVVK